MTLGFSFCLVLYKVGFLHILYFQGRVLFGSWQNLGSGSVRSCWVRILSHLCSKSTHVHVKWELSPAWVQFWFLPDTITSVTVEPECRFTGWKSSSQHRCRNQEVTKFTWSKQWSSPCQWRLLQALTSISYWPATVWNARLPSAVDDTSAQPAAGCIESLSDPFHSPETLVLITHRHQRIFINCI